MINPFFLRPADIMGRLTATENSFMKDRGDDDLNPGMPPQGELKPAAVLVPLIDRTGGLTMLLTERTAHLTNHPGQISFPGGHCDPEDGTPEETALRETEEEVGITRQHIEIIGRLAQYKTRTGFEVSPIVGIVKPEFTLAPDPHEVADVFEVPLSFLMNPANHKIHSRQFGGANREFYAIPYQNYFIWGATAGMLINFYDVMINR